MSKREYYGTELDAILQQPTNRSPDYRVYLWNPNLTDIHEVVLAEAKSPRYDVTPWVLEIDYKENIVFENNDDAVASHLSVIVAYDPDAEPIEITEKTFIDGAPIRVYQGDARVSEDQWPCIFTGVCRGVPTTTEYSRDEQRPQQLAVTAVDRAEKYLNKPVTARAYDQGQDVGKAAVETAIEWMNLERREIMIGDQDYFIAHPQSQLVDIEVLKGIAEILFTVGKKPRFSAEGFLVAADTDLDRAPARSYPNKDLVISIERQQILSSIYNSVRLLGLDDDLTEVVEQKKRLAHGDITSGFFEDEVRQWIYFSETEGKPKGGRRAKNTELGNHKISSLGSIFGEDVRWVPEIEDDGYTVFRGQIIFKTGSAPWLRAYLTGMYALWIVVEAELRSAATEAAANGLVGVVETLNIQADVANGIALAALILIILTLMELGHLYYEIHGEPFQHVYQQLCATAQVDGILTEDIHELELRNDWLFSIEYMRTRVKELLKRELIKGWSYKLVMIDDPLVEVDDIIEADGLKWYITSITKKIARPGDGTMTLTAWRLA